MAHKPMTRTQIEIASITGTWKNKPITKVNPMDLWDPIEIRDFLMVVNLYNAEVLDDMIDTQVAKKLLGEIGIDCGESTIDIEVHQQIKQKPTPH